jgi:hypothetical protein
MRRTTAAWVLGAALALLSGRAAATENKGDTGGKGGLGPQAPVENTTTGSDTSTVVPIQREVSSSKKTEQEKPWEIGATFETHRMFVQDDGAGSNKVFNTFAAYALYHLTEHDTFGIQEFVNEGFYADPGEPGTQAADPAVTYAHSVPLPRDFLFSARLSLSAPMSLQSQKAGLITAPHLGFGLNKKLGRYVNISANVTGGVFITRYAEQEGGGTNPLGSVSGGLSAEVMMPFHEPLSFGVTVNDIYAWYYNVQSSVPPEYGVVADATYPNQPTFQQYGGEIWGRYTLPTLAGAKGDISVSVADGDPGLGYNSYLHDGIGYTYLAYRLTGEVYAAITLRY